MMMRKGQTATEYLIILAVVIVIALIVVGVLGGIPGVGSSGQAKAGAAYWATTDPVAIKSFSNSATDGITVVFRNNGKTPYTINNFSLNRLQVNDTQITLPIGAEDTRTKIFAELPTSLQCGGSTLFSYEVAIEYTDQTTGASYEFIGTQKLEGNCAL